MSLGRKLLSLLRPTTIQAVVVNYLVDLSRLVNCETCGTMLHLEDGQRRGGNIQWTDASFTTSFQSRGRIIKSIEQLLT